MKSVKKNSQANIAQVLLTCLQVHRKILESERHANPSSYTIIRTFYDDFTCGTYNNMVASGSLQHICYQLGGNWSTATFLFILSGVREQRYNGGDTFCTCDLASMNHNTELHQCGVHSATASVDNINIILSNGLGNANGGLANTIAGNFSSRQRKTQPIKGRLKPTTIKSLEDKTTCERCSQQALGGLYL